MKPSFLSVLFPAALALTLIAPASRLSAQDLRTAGGERYVIEKVVFHIEGITWESRLRETVDIELGSSFASRAELDAYVADRTQILINQRVLAEAEIKTSFSPRADGAQGVRLDVHTRDSWNIIGLPYGRYDTNTGLQLSLRGRDFNFLGSMEQLRLDLDYRFTEDGYHELGAGTTFALPFRAADLDWRWTLTQGFGWNPAEDKTTFDLATTLAVNLPIHGQIFTLSAGQGYHLEDHEDLDGQYLASSLSFGTGIGLLDLGRYGRLSYNPSVSASYNWWPGRELSLDRRGLTLGFNHGLSAGRVDWIGNFRDGFNFSLTNSNPYNIERQSWDRSIEGSLTYFKAFEGGWLGFDSRLRGFLRFDSIKEDAGDLIRGIRNHRMQGDAAVYLNMDVPFVMWGWFFMRWFEFHLRPFVDAAIIKAPGDSFDISQAWYGFGIEGMAFPFAVRGFYARIMLGFDLEAFLADRRLTGPAPRDGDGRWEVFIGLGHHY